MWGGDKIDLGFMINHFITNILLCMREFKPEDDPLLEYVNRINIEEDGETKKEDM
jgi:hypothetical protein